MYRVTKEKPLRFQILGLFHNRFYPCAKKIMDLPMIELAIWCRIFDLKGHLELYPGLNNPMK
jgi:hypothetical protein